MLLELAQETDSSVSTVTVMVGILSMAGAIIAALVAALSASRSKRAEIESAHRIELQTRLGGSREELYSSWIEMTRELFLSTKSGGPLEPSEVMVNTLSRFATWIQIYGSDMAVKTMHKFQQASFSEAPAPILIRFYAEMMLAARRDLGDEKTAVSLVDLMGLSLNDIYPEYERIFTIPEPELFDEFDWQPPWPMRPPERSHWHRTISSGGLALLDSGRLDRHTFGDYQNGDVLSSGGLSLLSGAPTWR